jgi:hypothetical protein
VPYIAERKRGSGKGSGEFNHLGKQLSTRFVPKSKKSRVEAQAVGPQVGAAPSRKRPSLAGIGGLALGTKYGQLASVNGVSLAGTLNLKRLGGFVPAIGSNFTIVTGSALSGTFTTTNGLSINSAEHFQVNYTSTAVTVTVVSGP